MRACHLFVVLALLALALPFVRGWSSQGCRKNLPSVYGPVSEGYTRSWCNQQAINNRHEYFGMTAGGDYCQTGDSLPDGSCEPCDWNAHQNVGESCASGCQGQFGGPYDTSCGRTTVYTAEYPACSWSSKPSQMYGCDSVSDRAYCTPNCNAGYTRTLGSAINPSSTVYCRKLTATNSAVCTQNCAAPGAPTNGNVGSCAPANGVPLGSTCSVDCPAPYTRTGDSALTCLVTRSWSGVQRCAMPCAGPPPAKGNATFSMASPPPSAPALYPVGTVMTATCPAGLTLVNGNPRCNEVIGAAGQWSDSYCIDLRMKAQLSYDLTTMSPYSGLVTWTNPTLDELKIPLSRFVFRYKPALVFPQESSSDKLESALRGVQYAAGGSWVNSGSQPFAQLTADVDGQIEHARFALEIQADYTDPVSGNKVTGPNVVSSVSMPCSCDQEGALLSTLLSPTDALMFGTPLRPHVLQSLTAANQLLLRFMPNSICSDEYTISAGFDPAVPVTPSADGTVPVSDVLSRVVSQIHLENSQSCPFLSEQAEEVLQVNWPLHGRAMQICIQPNPRQICTTCTQSYGTLSAEGIVRGMPQTCVTYTPAFFFSVAGRVTTPITTFSRDPAPVPGVTVTVEVIDENTLELLLVPSDDDPTVMVPVRASAITDARGKYTVLVSSKGLTEKGYTFRIVPAKNDTDPDTGAVFPHEFEVVAQRDNNVIIDSTTHGLFFTGQDIYDISEVGLAGRIALSSDARTPEPFWNCGVGFVVVDAFLQRDTERLAPVRTSAPTSHDGAWVVSVPLYSKLVLVARWVGDPTTRSNTTASADTAVHTFEPAFQMADVRQSSIQFPPFFDTTTAEFSAEWHGGVCKYHLGMIAPVARLLSCGTQAHVLLSPFGSGGYTWRLPAQLYQFALQDGQDPLSGFQAFDLGDVPVPSNYIITTVKPWLDQQSSVMVDLRDVLTDDARPQLTWEYIAPADIVVARTRECVDTQTLVDSPSDAPYTFMYTGAMTLVKFVLSESYGYLSTDAQGEIILDRRRVCRNTTQQVQVLDKVTNDGSQLVNYYLEEPYSCTDSTQPCIMQTEYNNATDQTTANYILRVGDIRRSDNTDVEGRRLTPAYSRPLSYRLAGSVLPYQHLHVVIIGTYNFPGGISLTLPPWDPVYILRDPPGGASTASLTAGTVLETEESYSTSDGGTFGRDIDVSYTGGTVQTTCNGIGVAICSETLNSENKIGVQTAIETGRTNTYSKANVESTSFEQTVSTSGNPFYHDGDGDLFLTVGGLMIFTKSESVSLDMVADPTDTANPPRKVCQTALKPSVSWTKQSKQTMSWTSAWDIKNVIIPSFIHANEDLLAMYGVADKFALMQVAPSKYEDYVDNERHIVGWQSMLNYNQLLKDNAQAWPEFYKAMGTGKDDSQSSAAARLLAQAQAQAQGSNGGISATLVDPKTSSGTGEGSTTNEFAIGESANFALQADDSIGSITFYGGGSSLTFTLTTESTESESNEVVLSTSVEANVYIEFQFEVLGVGLESSMGTKGAYTHEQGSSSSTSRTSSRTIEITLADDDIGDAFTVEIMKDAVFGSPVYRLLSGQSRCAAEIGTMPRDDVLIELTESTWEHVSPNDPISTTLQMTNLSPTKETFQYALSIPPESNLYGLRVSMNGASLTAQALTVTLPYNQQMRFTIDIERGSNGYVFDGIELGIEVPDGPSGPDGTLTCFNAAAILNVHYDEPCARTVFAGSLASTPSFTVNQRLLAATASGLPSLPLAIRNPEVTLPGRKWIDLAEKEADADLIIGSGFLQSLEIQYRPAPAGLILSELDWSPILTVGAGLTPVNILNRIRDDEEATGRFMDDVYAAEWNMAVLTDGPYQLRTVSKCRVPLGKLDTSLYTFATAPITGTLDIVQPRVFGTPVPATTAYLPGQPIEITFDQAINCESYWGKPRVDAWINAGTLTGGQTQGLFLAVNYVCRDHVLAVAFQSALWTELVGRLVTVRVSNVRDAGGNPIDAPIQWSFPIAQFAVNDAPVTVSNLFLESRALSALQAQYGSLAALQQALAQEVADLANLAIDTVLRPTPRASSSVDGLMRGNVQVASLTAASASLIRFTITIQSLPAFPGEPLSVYAPSTFADYFVRALSTTVNQSAVVLGLPQSTWNRNVTIPDLDAEPSTGAELTEDDVKNLTFLWNNNVTFPLLSAYRAQAAWPVRSTIVPMPTVEQAATAQAQTRMARMARMARVSRQSKVATPTAAAAASAGSAVPSIKSRVVSEEPAAPTSQLVSEVLARSVYNAQGKAALVSLSWQTDGAAAVQLALENLRISYSLPNEAAEKEVPIGSAPAATDTPTPAVTVDLSDSNVATLQQRTNGSLAVYRVLVRALPVPAGGRLVRFAVSVVNATSSPLNASALYLFETDLFVQGAPSVPLVQRVEQTAVDELHVAFAPVWNNGLATEAGDAGVMYRLQLLASATAQPVTLAASALSMNNEVLVGGALLKSMRIVVSNLSQLGFPLPLPGRVSSWTVRVSASNELAESVSSLYALSVQSAPPSLPLLSVEQSAFNVFELSFYQPTLDAAAQPLDEVALSYAYTDANGTTGSATQTLHWQHDFRTLATATDQVAPVRQCTLELPSALLTVRMLSLKVSLSASSRWGRAPPVWSTLSSNELAFVHPTAMLNVTVLGDPVMPVGAAQPQQTVELQWVAVTDAFPRPSLLQSYVVSVIVSDGLLLSITLLSDVYVPMVNGQAVYSTNVTLPLLSNSVPGVPLIYSFQVRTMMKAGSFVLASAPAQVPLAVVQQRFWNALEHTSDGQPLPPWAQVRASSALHSGMQRVAQQPLVDQQHPLSDSVLVSSGPVQVSSRRDSATAPVDPSDFEVWQMGATNFLVRMPRVLTSSPSFPSASAPMSFVVVWQDAEAAGSAQLGVLGSARAEADLVLDGALAIHLSDANARSLDVGRGEPHAFLFSLYAVNAAGERSARISKFATVQARTPAGPDSWPQWVSGLIATSFSLNVVVLIVLLYVGDRLHVFTRLRALLCRGSQARSSSAKVSSLPTVLTAEDLAVAGKANVNGKEDDDEEKPAAELELAAHLVVQAPQLPLQDDEQQQVSRPPSPEFASVLPDVAHVAQQLPSRKSPSAEAFENLPLAAAAAASPTAAGPSPITTSPRAVDLATRWPTSSSLPPLTHNVIVGNAATQRADQKRTSGTPPAAAMDGGASPGSASRS